MIELRVLGALNIREVPKGRIFQSVLTQPKRTALLAYLALARPRGFHRRDTLFGTFWPEASQESARNALNQAVFVLRRALGSEVIVTRGADEVGLDPGHLWCDAAAFEAALEKGDEATALELYGGDLLEGFYISDCLHFERWLEQERARLRERAERAAVKVAEEHEAAGDAVEAIYWLRRATAWAPYEEGTHRRLLILLGRLGDRAGALREYETFRKRLEEDLELEPSAGILALVEEIRRQKDTEVLPAQPPAGLVSSSEPGGSAPREKRMRHPVWAFVAVGFVALVLLIGAASLFGPPESPIEPAIDPRRVLVAAFENRTGDPALEPLGFMAGDWIAQGLLSTGLVRVVPFSTVIRETPSYVEVGSEGESGASGRALARQTGAALLVSGSFYESGDSITFDAQLIDVASGELLRGLHGIRGSLERPEMAVEELGRRTVGAVAAHLDERLESWANPASQPPSMAAYQLFSEGLDLFQRANSVWDPADPEQKRLNREAADRFRAAAATDSSFTGPLLWAVFAYANAFDLVAAESLAKRLFRRRDLTLWDRAVLDYQLPMLAGNYEAKYEAARKLVELSPDSEFLLKLGQSAYETGRFREAIDALEKLDPDRGWIKGFASYWHFLVFSRHAVGDHESELREVARARSRYPDDPALPLLEMRALAALGRGDSLLKMVIEALASSDERVLSNVAWTVMELRAHDHSETADRLLRVALADYESASTVESLRQGPEGWRFADLLYLTGRWDETRARYETLARENPDDVSVFLRARLGVLAARRGALREARQVSDWLEELTANESVPSRRDDYTVLRAAIATHLSEPEEAVQLLREAFAGGFRHGYMWLHMDPDFDSLRDLPSFQELLRPRG